MLIWAHIAFARKFAITFGAFSAFCAELHKNLYIFIRAKTNTNKVWQFLRQSHVIKSRYTSLYCSHNPDILQNEIGWGDDFSFPFAFWRIKCNLALTTIVNKGKFLKI